MLFFPTLSSWQLAPRKVVATLVTASNLALCALGTPAQANELETILGGGVGAAAGAILGQQMGGHQGAVIGGAIGGATGAAVSTHGPGKNGAVIGGAIGGAAGAAVGQSSGGRNGAVLGAGVGGAAGATIGKGVTQRQPDSTAQHPYAQGRYVQPAGYYTQPPHYGWDRHDDRWRHGRHGNGHAYGHDRHDGRDGDDDRD